MSSTTDHKSLVPHHKFSIGGRSLSCFLLVVFFFVPQDALALSVGDRVVVQNVGSIGLNVRTGAGTGYSVIGKVYDGAKGTITSGPRNANGYTWWKVRWNSSHHGWSVDYYDGDRLIFLDEPAVKPSISSVGNDSATEGNTLRFTVRLSTSTSQAETYYYSTYYGGNATAERGDYDGVAEESIRVSSGRSSFTIRIDTNEDADFDDETFYLYVTGEANHPNTTPGSSKYRGTGTIRDDDEPAVKPSISSVGNASATEGNTLSFTVRLRESTSQSETYYYSTYHGTPATAEVGDYDGAVDQSVQVSSGQSSFTIRISTYQDADGDDEIFFVHVAKNSGSGPDTNPNTTPGPSQYRGTGTIRDNDKSVTKPSISSVGDASATEGNTLSFTVTLSASTSQTETYYYSTYYGGGATAEREDYDGVAEESIRVSSGRSSFTVRIDTNEDADFDDETFYLYVTGEANHPNSTPSLSKYRGTGTIRDDDAGAVPQTYRIRASDGNVYQISWDLIHTGPKTFSVLNEYGTPIVPNENVAAELYMALLRWNKLPVAIRSDVRSLAEDSIILLRTKLTAPAEKAMNGIAVNLAVGILTGGTHLVPAIVDGFATISSVSAKTAVLIKASVTAVHAFRIAEDHERKFAESREKITSKLRSGEAITLDEIKSAYEIYLVISSWYAEAKQLADSFYPLPNSNFSSPAEFILNLVPFYSTAKWLVHESPDAKSSLQALEEFLVQTQGSILSNMKTEINEIFGEDAKSRFRDDLNRAGFFCTYNLSPPGPIQVPVGGGSFFIQVTTQDGCPWTVSQTDYLADGPFEEIAPTSGEGNGSFNIRVSANSGTEARTVGTLAIGRPPLAINGPALVLNQAGANQAVTGDFDGNGVVNVQDFLIFATQFGKTSSDEGFDARMDMDGDGLIGVGDFLIFTSNFGNDG